MLRWQSGRWLKSALACFVLSVPFSWLAGWAGANHAREVARRQSYGSSDDGMDWFWSLWSSLLGQLPTLCLAAAVVCCVFAAIRFGFELADELLRSRAGGSGDGAGTP